MLVVLERLNLEEAKNRDINSKKVAWDLIKIYFYNYENLEYKFNNQSAEDFESIFPKLLYSLKNLPEAILNKISSWIFKYHQDDENCEFEELEKIVDLEETKRK